MLNLWEPQYLTSRQKAFDKEQEVFEKYKNYKYHGINGEIRWNS